MVDPDKHICGDTSRNLCYFLRVRQSRMQERIFFNARSDHLCHRAEPSPLTGIGDAVNITLCLSPRIC